MLTPAKAVNTDSNSLRYCQVKNSTTWPCPNRISRLTWSQVLCVRDQVLHRLHHLRHRQVLQDAFAHTDYFADLWWWRDKTTIKAKWKTMMQHSQRMSDYGNTALPLPIPILSNYTLIMLHTDIPASLSCFTPASCELLYRAMPELHWKTWWQRWLMTPADCCRQPDVCYQRADLQLFFILSVPERNRAMGLIYDSAAWFKI